MLLIIEVALTIAAWRRGWGARAFLPGFVGIVFALLLGGLMGAAGADKTSLLVVSVLTDLALISVLSWFARHAPRPKVASVPEAMPTEAEAGTAATAH